MLGWAWIDRIGCGGELSVMESGWRRVVDEGCAHSEGGTGCIGKRVNIVQINIEKITE